MNFEGFLEGIDAIFYSRVSYEKWGNYKPDKDASETEKSLRKAVKFVFSSKPQNDKNAIRKSSDIAEKAAEIKNPEGKNIWLYGVAKLISIFINLRLIDNYRHYVRLTAVGNGKPLIENLNKRLKLKLLIMKRFYSGEVQLIYEPE